MVILSADWVDHYHCPSVKWLGAVLVGGSGGQARTVAGCEETEGGDAGVGQEGHRVQCSLAGKQRIAGWVSQGISEAEDGGRRVRASPDEIGSETREGGARCNVEVGLI